ncbi:GNAT family N-acetyltransferase [Neorhizobium sp. P12A]|uniref:GNAT family N-acetyltransferase n=1 Tax=Neorhizobium sp. P12A TaxID=2268027 RepID=UPI0011EC8AF9|nr:GNAT family N-acetyltransferase [Neorhizobium sp. P12A]KAA0687991.1 GNAT family N-acetyltransferase [Neorhizobium sp. P12A]
MTGQEELEFLKVSQAHDDVVIRHYLAIWESYGTPADHFSEDSEEIIRGYMERGRRDRQLATFIAFDEGEAVASVSCQLHAMPYPVVLKPDVALQGYIWTVYVDPAYRRRGISRKLLAMAIEHLREIGCTTVVLHSSDAGEPLYESLGFAIAKEMRLQLIDPSR